ncbi:CBO0543 family protein [Halalkalibacter alkalisediminis]|uniref:CBO0543 family protein n=1 Tax=Halalkalibacter alkalisediminis TaxID=935616 RepID=A0ABV6N9W1_9BACI|nr:CBO0543 family protein [Halalkalibacter alkalisediminis]
MLDIFKLISAMNLLTINPSWDEIIQLRIQIRNLLLDYWLTESLFSFNWWFLLSTSIFIFIIWLIVLDKKRIIEIITFGLLVGTITFILDLIGTTLVLWSYPDRIIPMVPPILEIHKLHLPIIYMIVYQYFNTWKSFFLATTISSFTFSFLLEPLTVWLGIYEIYHWKYIYSFPIYIFLGITIRWALINVKEYEKR